MKVTWLPDVEPRPRRVAVGEFDGVHLGHREVIRGADTVLTFEPHPLAVIRPEAAPKLLTRLDAQGRAGRRPRGRGARGHPVRPRLRPAQRARSSSTTCSSARSGPRTSRSGENFRFGHKARATPELLARRQALRDPRRRRWSRSRGRSSPRRHIRGLVAARRRRARRPPPRRPVPAARHRGRTATGAGARSASRRPTSCPTTRSSCPGHGVYAAVRRRTRPAAVNVGVRPTFEHRAAACSSRPT